MPQAEHYIDAPRSEVILKPAGQERYETWLVLRVPDGKPPTTVRLDGPNDRTASIESILSIYTTIGEHHAFGQELFPDRDGVVQ